MEKSDYTFTVGVHYKLRPKVSHFNVLVKMRTN